jgi:hypothetical protein
MYTADALMNGTDAAAAMRMAVTIRWLIRYVAKMPTASLYWDPGSPLKLRSDLILLLGLLLTRPIQGVSSCAWKPLPPKPSVHVKPTASLLTTAHSSSPLLTLYVLPLHVLMPHVLMLYVLLLYVLRPRALPLPAACSPTLLPKRLLLPKKLLPPMPPLLLKTRSLLLMLPYGMRLIALTSYVVILSLYGTTSPVHRMMLPLLLRTCSPIGRPSS